jgi:hypothetical protein
MTHVEWVSVSVEVEALSVSAEVQVPAITAEWRGVLVSEPTEHIYDGSGPPPADLGDTGDYYLDNDSGVLWKRI